MIPARQVSFNLPDVAFFQEGPGLRNWQWADDGVKVINGTNILQDGSIDITNTDKFIAQAEFEGRYRHFAINEGDIVLSSSGTLGKVGRITADHLPLMMNTSVIRFRTKNSSLLDDGYLFAFLRSPIFQSLIRSFAVGGVQQNFGPSHLKQIRISLPSINTQRRIADILSAYDDLIENNQRRMALLEEAARQLYREWFVRLRFPGHEHTPITSGVPEEWERKRMGDIANCVGGGTPSTTVPAYWEDGKLTWVTPTDVTRNQHFVLLDSEKKITEAGLQNSSAKIVPSHAVLMTSRASVGFFAVAGREVCTNQGFISIVPHQPSLSSYLLFHLSERVEEIRTMGSGSTYPEVSRGKFRELEMLVPRCTLVSSFDEQVTLLLKQIRSLKLQDRKLRAARDLLLPRLMSSEISV